MTSAAPTRRLAAFAAALRFDDLPPAVVHAAKRLTLDTLGCALAATTLGAGVAPVVAVMTSLGGPPEATLLGTATKLGVANAAFVNGALTNALNYSAAGADVGHTGIACLAAQLAVAQARGPVSGRRFLAAVVAGAESSARLALASSAVQQLGVERLFLAGQFFSYLPAAAGAGSLLGLDADGMQSAFGLALMQVAGTRQVIAGGDPPAKAIYGAFPNQGGVLAALLAAGGLDARIDALEGRAGLYALAGGTVDEDVLLGDLGGTYALLRTTFKPWPTSAVAVPFIEAAIGLARAHDLRAGDVEAIEIVGSPQLRQWCEPPAARRRPANAAAAANSVLFTTAAALAHRALALADFTAAGLQEPDALALAGRTSFRAADAEPAAVCVRTRGGRRLHRAVEAMLGSPSRPLDDEQLRAKFRDCCRYAPALQNGDVEATIAFIDRIEDAADVSPLADLAALRANAAQAPRRRAVEPEGQRT